VWLDHQKAANGGQPAGTPQSSVVAASSTTPVAQQQSAAAVAGTVAGLAVAGYAAAASGVAADRSVSATLFPEDTQQTGTPPADSTTPESQGPAAAAAAHETDGTAAGQQQPAAETAGGMVRSAVRALEFGGEPVVVGQSGTQATASSPLTGSPESPVALAAEAGEDSAAAEPAAAEQQGITLMDVPSQPADAAPASVVVEPAQSLPLDARLADAVPAEEGREASGNAAADDGVAGMADSAAELRALLTIHRAEMRAGSDQLRAQFETGQARGHMRQSP